jgi:hypothetical protein
MKIQTVCCALIVVVLVSAAATSTLSLAQSGETAISGPKDAGAMAKENAARNTNMTPSKHRYWRHRGGSHPHYGSRRVRT